MKRIIMITAAAALMFGTADAANGGADTDQRLMRGVHLFSLRPEYSVVFGEINTFGVIGEAGMVDSNGLFLSFDFAGGIHCLGGGLNIGYSFESDFGMKNAVGYSFGFYNTDIVTKFEAEDGEELERDVGNYAGITGLFWKVKWGRDGHLDITNRLMFGYKSNSVWYDESRKDDPIYIKKGFAASYSISAGYTFVRRR